MNIRPTLLIVLLFFLFFLFAFYLEVSTYSILPSSVNGMSFWMEFQSVWYRSIWFYAMVLCIGVFITLGIIRFKRK